jgi:DNA polymerase-1
LRILLLDGYNLIHRARFGFGEGDFNVVFNFFRGLRPLVEKFTPDKVYFVLEGYPKENKTLLPEYKANRVRVEDSFYEQKNKIISLIKTCMPIDVIRHPDFECDDVLYNIAKQWHANDHVFIVSSDTDFIQVYSDLNDVTIWNPIKKKVVIDPGYDYVLWKALRGDKTDNIPGIKGIGDKTAEYLVNNKDMLEERKKDAEFNTQLERNISLIKFADLTGRMGECETHKSLPDWDALKLEFEKMEFASMTNDASWKKFIETYKCIA